ncbi:molybdopterin-guanine dinucleotide biosynthesis protein B [Undibacterium pigrum]|uniref:Molybdopterin-guanine dinucleotide biosynthesis protein B n=2 Tax=Undibacterium pigrum TaxID=401470 RepID=A0A318JDZ7_9BURK|nr:molybdopterin-guanine dinucleotide biosynthesis protein B [Undibacterium pigrum]PXX47828.1 molybdopterin-guanine dinucleotide biosynthesis protein B [Undibacterium pigrum]
MAGQILGVVGWSGSGKTSLLEYLVRELTASGHKINVVKHSHHDVVIEPPQKDSSRLRHAGAQEVLLASPYRYVIVHELRQEAEPTLRELVSHLAFADLTMVEGYKWETISKIEVFRPSLGKAAIYTEDEDILAVASDVPAPLDLRPGVQWLDLNQPRLVLHWIIAAMQNNILKKI